MQERTPLVCVHGAGAGGWEWAIWARVFAARGRAVIAPDLMPADAGLAATHFADYRAQVVHWCGAAGAAPILAGASLGGLLALSAAAQLRPAALVLVNPLPPAGVLARPLRRAAGHVQRERPGAIVPWGRSRSLGGTRRALEGCDDAACLYAYRRWRDESGTVLAEARDGVAVEPPRCPILVLSGGRDQEVPPSVGRALATRLGADFVCTPAAGHVDPLLGRIAAGCAERVAAWLSLRLDGAAAPMR
ncbi:MAG TPA: alpha/beta fold hydrolase [Dokdonella sp.]|uniref:alpha/beta fold hydrolase n=1 Tax=Dokdonella sp. TaxID=2291710 RepID=UPI002BD2B6A7|nr:alpha/beta fold hydrolase [Dokdonella sp.]HUD43118.1 alpha/beta fold hydrolase [Dokdonella sp.]